MAFQSTINDSDNLDEYTNNYEAKLENEKQKCLHEFEKSLDKLLCNLDASKFKTSSPLLTDGHNKINGGHQISHSSSSHHHQQHHANNNKPKQHSNQNPPPQKIFEARKSELTILMENPHFRAVRNLFLAVLIIFSLHTLLREWVVMTTNQNVKDNVLQHDHVATLLSLFSGFSHVVIVWLQMFIFTQLGIYIGLVVYSRLRWRLRLICNLTTLDYAALIAYFIYLLAFLIYPVYFARQQYVAPACMIIVLCEQLRFLMKGHAFVRETVVRVQTLHHLYLNEQKSSSSSSSSTTATTTASIDNSGSDGVPDFSNYLYFMFAPTAVYRDSYPRNDVVHWDFVLSQMLSIVLCIIFVYYSYFRYTSAVFHDFSQHNLSASRLLLDLCSCIIPGSISLLLGFFSLLHAWMNAFAEMLRFADRQFYRNWWTASNYPAYYRLWNCVVHDWLYTYIYRDFILFSGNRLFGLMLTFILSAFFHEYVLSLAFGFFYPVLLIMFGGLGLSFAFVKGRADVWNIGIWFSLFMGMGVMTFLYTLEWYARQHCPSNWPLPWDFFIPRTFMCFRT